MAVRIRNTGKLILLRVYNYVRLSKNTYIAFHVYIKAEKRYTQVWVQVKFLRRSGRKNIKERSGNQPS